ncbi:MAG: TonB family protein [Candidatus Eiseniibacteriota bacterium]
MSRAGRLLGLAAVGGICLSSCAYFNTLYNARLKFAEAQDLARKADPEREKISPQEERLYTEAFEKAARVVKFHPESKWVDDALLLMGKTSFEKGDYSTALRKFDEVLTFYPESELTGEALLMKGRTLIQAKDYDAGIQALSRAVEANDDEFRDDVAYFLGAVHHERGNLDEALAAYADVVSHYRKSEWFAEAGLAAGDIEMKRGNAEAAVGFFEQVRRHGSTLESRYHGGMRKGEALLSLKEYARARTTFRDAADRVIDVDDRGHALLMEGRAAAAAGDADEARRIFRSILVDYEHREAAADAQLAMAEMRDEVGDLTEALAEYELVKEQGTGHPAWQKATARRSEIQRVLDLRAAVAESTEVDRDKNRFLLAEQLLERIGDVDGALAEYDALSKESPNSEWGARALFARAWILEHRLGRPEAADSVLFTLANYHAGTEVDAFARRRLGYPVWRVEEVEPPPVQFVREESDDRQVETVLSRVEPRAVALPAGVDQVKVWVRVRVGEEGTPVDAKVAKSGGAEFDEAAVEAARASRFLAPSAGGPEYTVMEYEFPPRSEPPAGEPSAAERDAMLDARDATPVDTLVAPVDSSAAPPDSILPPGSAAFRDRLMRERLRRDGDDGDS